MRVVKSFEGRPLVLALYGKGKYSRPFMLRLINPHDALAFTVMLSLMICTLLRYLACRLREHGVLGFRPLGRVISSQSFYLSIRRLFV